MSNKNKSLALRIIDEIFNGAVFNHFDELIAADVVIHDTDKQLYGKEQLKQGIIKLHTAFPDLHYTVEDIFSLDDKVTIRCKGKGTHEGNFRGIHSTGKQMSYTVILIWRFADHKLVEHWAVSDVYGMLQQLDVIEIKPAEPEVQHIGLPIY